MPVRPCRGSAETSRRDAVIAWAVTGPSVTQDCSPHVSSSPKDIAGSAIAAAKAGAAMVQCLMRDPETGKPSRQLDLCRELTDRIRAADVDVGLNLTAGMGGYIVFGTAVSPVPVNAAGTDMAGASERMVHVIECLPEICTLDCGTMTLAEADYVMIDTPGMLRAMGRMMTDLWFAKELVREGTLTSFGTCGRG